MFVVSSWYNQLDTRWQIQTNSGGDAEGWLKDFQPASPQHIYFLKKIFVYL